VQNGAIGVLNGLTILIVEDEYLIALEAQRIAEEAGAAQVILANAVEEVRKLLTSGVSIDVAVLDLRLGSEDASPLIHEFTTRNTPLIIATGLEADIPIGAILLAKPYRDADFVAVILSALKRPV